MKKLKLRPQNYLDLIWFLTLIGLPITSFPLFAKLMGSMVMPFSALPALFLLIIWFIPYVIRRGLIPVESKPIFIFLLIALTASAGAFFLSIPHVKNTTIAIQELRAFSTLMIGLTFYFLFATWHKNPKDLSKTLRWTSLGGALLVVWTLLQVGYILLHSSDYPSWVRHIQGYLVVPSPNFSPRHGRVVGLTYEPSWFAHQMILLYLPIWLAASLQRISAFKFRFMRLCLEDFLLPIGLLEFYLCSPRISLISLSFIVISLLLKLGFSTAGKLTVVIRRNALSPLISEKSIKAILSILLYMMGIVGFGVIIKGLVFLGGQHDWRLTLVSEKFPSRSEIFGVLFLDENMLLVLSKRLAFIERAFSWITGWRVFNLYPFLGVGLGNAGFFALDQMPSLGWAYSKIRTMLINPDILPNTKSLWFRLLAETGIVGFSIILAWFYLLWRSTRLSQHSDEPVQKVIALAGELFLVAFIAEGFSIDYLAMPYLWGFAGLISANGLIHRAKLRTTSHVQTPA